MSNINIKRTIENIRAVTTVYTPVVEMIVNAIQAIDESGRTDGKVEVRVIRKRQTKLYGGLPDISGFEIQDNGIGFTDEHRDSFDTLYTDRRIAEGGKGFGRFTCLKYFEDLYVTSVFDDGTDFKRRRFSMGKNHEIIENEILSKCDRNESGTTVSLVGLKEGPAFDKKLVTVARNIAERLLPFFITKDYICPDIEIREQNGEDLLHLNDFVNNEMSLFIREMTVESSTFPLGGARHNEQFIVRVFKFYSPKNQKSKISLVAHKREVSGSALQRYVPEFEDEFYETEGQDDRTRNYIIKAYVFGSYLDRNVSVERGGFEFSMENDLFRGIAQRDIEKAAAEVAKLTLGSNITHRQEKKRKRVQTYVDEEAPWHKSILSKVDLSTMPYKPTHEEIESVLQKDKYAREVSIKRDVAHLMSESNLHTLKENVVKVVGKISATSKDELIHYIALRRNILDLFFKSLEMNESGGYSSEGVVHDIVFPRRGDSETIQFHDHNLWIVDERLNFTNYVSSDVQLSKINTERPDLLVYGKRVLFRGDNEASNPITIFEFKRPQRDDFTNPSAKEDPIQQIIRYANDIRDGKYRTPQGRDILVADNTPFYGFVVCDLTRKVKMWLEREKNFTPMPDGLGWFQWIGNINLYIEVNSWDKVLKDAQMRNRIFFEKLGI